MPIFAMLQGGLGMLKRYPWIILALLGAVALWWVVGLKSDLTLARQTIKQMSQASEAAAALQQASDAENQDLHRRIAEDAVSRHNQIAPAADAAAAAYKRDNGLRAYCARSPGSATPAAVHGDTAATGDVPTTADMVVVTAENFDASKDVAVHDNETTSFLIDQVNAGLAIVQPEK